MATAKPEVVIYAVRERAAGGDTPLPAAECEAALAALAGAAHAAGAWVLYVSSDEVFLGRGGSHRPEDPACPAGPAGELKVRLEAALARATGGDCGVLRLPPLYGALSKIGESSVTVLAKLVFPRVRAGAKVDDWLRRFPTHAADAAAAALRLAEARAKGGAGVRGAWHYAADTPLTDLQIVIVIADILRADIAPGGAPALEAAVGDESRPQESAPPTPPYPSPRGALARPGACCEATFLARARAQEVGLDCASFRALCAEHGASPPPSEPPRRPGGVAARRAEARGARQGSRRRSLRRSTSGWPRSAPCEAILVKQFRLWCKVISLLPGGQGQSAYSLPRPPVPLRRRRELRTARRFSRR